MAPPVATSASPPPPLLRRYDTEQADQAGNPSQAAAPNQAASPSALEPSRSLASFRLPQFMPEEPELWLLQVRCAFDVAGVTDDNLRFKLVVANLPPNIAATVKDVIRTSNSFTALSQALQSRLAQSRAERLKTLLSRQQLGDQKPSALLRAMRSELSAAGDAPVDTELFRTLFLQRLPQHVRAALALLPADSSLDQLAEAADRYMEASGSDPHIAAVVPAAPQPHAAPPSAAAATASPSGLEVVVAALVAKLERLESSNRRLENAVIRDRGRSRRSQTPRRQRPATPGRPASSPSPTRRLCWYHQRFGADAFRCTPPCSWPAENESA